MRSLTLSLSFLAALVGVLAWADSVDATTVCQGGSGPTVANTCQGFAHTSTNDALGTSARCFALRTTNSAPTCTTSGITPVNEATWQLVAGACVTFYYFDTATGVAPPPVPNKVSIAVGFDNTATIIITYLSMGAEPASGTSYSFCATNDGLVTGSPRAGTYSLVVNAVKDDALGGVGNYNVHSGVNGVARDRGALRGQMLVPTITTNAPASGSIHAYGPSGDESVTVTSSFTTPNGDANVETMRDFIVDDVTFLSGQIGATVDVDSGSLAQAFVVDDTFPMMTNYVAGVNIIGNSVLTGLDWTEFASAGHGAGLSVLTPAIVYNTTQLTIDPRILLDSDESGTFATADDTAETHLTNMAGPHVSVLNRGETVHVHFGIFNARSELLSRQMTVHFRDASDTDCGNAPITPTGTTYEFATAIPSGGSCTVVATEAGAARHIRVSNTDKVHLTGQVFGVSSLYFVDAHTQISSTLSQDDFPTENANEDFTFTIQGDGMGGDNSDTIHGWCHVVTVRKDGTDIDTSGNAVSWTLKDPTAATRSSGSTDTGADGWTGLTANMLASTPLGMWEFACTATFNGNTGTYAQDIAVVVAGGNGTIENFMADPLKVYTALNDAGDLLVAVSASYLDGSARTGAASEINVTIYDPSWTAVVSSANPDEVGFGAYSLNYTPLTSGLYFIVVNTTDPSTGDPVGVSNAFALNANVGSLMHDTAFATLTGLTGSEFAALLALAVVGVILWLRSTDVGVRAFGAILPMVAGVLVLFLTVQQGVGTLWSGSLGLGAMLLILGGYLLVRLFLDDFLQKRAAGEA